MGPGAKPDPVPPKLTTQGNAKNWDRPGAFGPVPADVAARGNSVCNGAGFKGGAIGYHPAAMDAEGKPFNGGGFLCAKE